MEALRSGTFIILSLVGMCFCFDNDLQEQIPILEEQTLIPFIFDALPLGSIHPSGWLRSEMESMASGLPGYQYEFYGKVRNNVWLGGNEEYSALNEAFPYWYNAIVYLAYGLDDQRLKEQVLDATRYVIAHQFDDGWLGPEVAVNTRNFWARYPLLLGLTGLLEADPITFNFTLAPIWRFVDLMHTMLSNNYQGYVRHEGDHFDDQWGRTRMQDMILSLQWLFENASGGREKKLLECMKWLNDKANDWTRWYTKEVYPFGDLKMMPPDWLNAHMPFIHGVNVAQGLKAAAVVRRFSHNDSLLETARNGVNWTFTYHGDAAGGIVGDEMETGRSPQQGTELCAVVEAIFSLAYLQRSLGDGDFGDMAELAAYNALPTMITTDHWAHQYVASINQPFARPLPSRPFTNVGPYGQIFGLEPNYPCCTVNFPQGLPKFLAGSWVRVGDTGLAHALLGPSSVSVILPIGKVTVSCETEYPHGDVLRYDVFAEAPFDLYVRVPRWTNATKSCIERVEERACISVLPHKSTRMHKIHLDAGHSIVTYHIDTAIRTVARGNATVAVRLGAVLYALDVGQTFDARPARDYRGTPFVPRGPMPKQVRDYRVDNTLSWNVAIDPLTLRLHRQKNPGLTALGCDIPWPIQHGLPVAPSLSDRTCMRDARHVTLLPYGTAKIHMAELPVACLRPEC